ncbi:cytochrome P450 [Penicillium cataractarum]|uniref:Cytochrome P450 n=1 Tax=Penicillium cataractarum TaxID=2100454 RepID=A0A9W9RE17_9EURO|nr:cytochrome P450 [Penicillium cataractarum]KAJ5358371.1 cytochrome P450 [Penicillium cataractarum]
MYISGLFIASSKLKLGTEQNKYLSVMLITTFILALGLVSALGYAIYHGTRHDPREPPVISSGIPFIGHLIGIARHGIEYIGLQTRKHPPYPILSLDMIASKIHVVASPGLIYAVQRNNKIISFDPLLTIVAKQVAGLQGDALNIIREVESEGHGLGREIMNAMIPTLTGKSLDKMTHQILRSLRPFFDDLDGIHTVDLYDWCRHAITVSSTDAKYGHLNPYKDRATADEFWSFQSNFSLLLADLFPWLTARKAWKGRELVVSAMTQYYLLGGHENSSDITLALFNTARDAGLSIEETARLESIVTIALLSNTVPATFWVLFDLYSRPKLLGSIREEIEHNVLRVTAHGLHIVNLSDIRDNCPLLISTFQEILRTRTTAASMRIVMKDVLLAQQYFLKAGSILTMPAEAIGRSPNIWGSSADEFDERRYMKSVSSGTGIENKTRDARRVGGLMTFGVPPTLCPGRHLASGEILGLAAMMVLQYDLFPASGVWQEPRRSSLSLVSVMGPLKDPFNTIVRKREGFESTSWEFRLEEGKGNFPLQVG